MVACTSLGLPYQEGSDAPCDFPEVWCNFTDILETQLQDIGSIINRTAVAVPFAKVIRDSFQVMTPNQDTLLINEAISWEGVKVDNDNMVDLSADPLHIYVRRPGIYMVDVFCRATPYVNGIALTNVNIELRTLESSTFVDHYVASRFTIPSVGTAVHIVTMAEVTPSDFSTYVTPSFAATIAYGINSASIHVGNNQFTVTWVAEAVNP